VPPGTSMVFSGLASDPEDGPVPVESLVWTSDVDGELGAGGDVVTDLLSAGTHVITLSATDSDGMAGHTQIRVHVGLQQRLYLPVLLRKR